MKVVPIPCLQDNYAYLVICLATRQAAVIDPAEAGPVLEAVSREEVTLVAILNTHHHADHVAGNQVLLQSHPHLAVYGHVRDQGRIQGLTHPVQDGDNIQVGQLMFRVLYNPGHTQGAVTYLVQDHAFTGDTLFGAGCGRLFEGTPEAMYHSLNHVLAALPDATHIYFGHEYTEANLRFAAMVEPDNPWVANRLEQVHRTRKMGGLTTPSSLAMEKMTNPFLRLDSPSLNHTVHSHHPDTDTTPQGVFASLRKMKDVF